MPDADERTGTPCPKCGTAAMWNGAAGVWVCPECGEMWTHQVVAEVAGPSTCPLCYSVATSNLAVTQWLCPRCGCTWQPGERTTPLPAELDPRIKAVLPVAPGSALVVQLAPADNAEALEGYVNELVEQLPEGCNVVFVYGDTTLRAMPVTVADIVDAMVQAHPDPRGAVIADVVRQTMAEAVLVLLAERGAWRHAG